MVAANCLLTFPLLTMLLPELIFPTNVGMARPSWQQVSYLRMYDVMRLCQFLLYDGYGLELAVVIVSGGAAARQRHERAVRLWSVIEPGAVMVVRRTHATAALQLSVTPNSINKFSKIIWLRRTTHRRTINVTYVFYSRHVFNVFFCTFLYKKCLLKIPSKTLRSTFETTETH